MLHAERKFDFLFMSCVLPEIARSWDGLRASSKEDSFFYAYNDTNVISARNLSLPASCFRRLSVLLSFLFDISFYKNDLLIIMQSMALEWKITNEPDTCRKCHHSPLMHRFTLKRTETINPTQKIKLKNIISIALPGFRILAPRPIVKIRKQSRWSP